MSKKNTANFHAKVIAACELLAATGIAVQIPGMTTTVLLATFLLAAALMAPVRRECE
ncbi:hypothetical protein [Rhodococcoides fascians]|uniref:hypothetical protein n=1 Tax=Rhodococcoides fascians TaxID=1828 RepID=UPI000B130EF1|nr:MULTISPECIES: hypothetical protein [Rhodococcus]